MNRVSIRKMFALLVMLAAVSIGSTAQDTGTGVTVNIPEKTQPGYILVSMLQSNYAFLLSQDGRVVKHWESAYSPALSTYLTNDGTLIRAGMDTNAPYGPTGAAGFMGGIVEIFNWDGDLLNTVVTMEGETVAHHDIEPMPNGNILVLAYERFSGEAALARGLRPELLPEDNEFWSESIVEIDPTTGETVWRWDVWDHLIQDADPDLPDYGVVAEHPERIDINYTDSELSSDWLHMNAVAYNAELDQVILNSKNFSEFWIIDHSISTEDAAGPAGDLLYRWGNPEAASAGTDDDQILFAQHNAYWIPDGLPGAGNILIFDNGAPERPYSSVVEMAPARDADGRYVMNEGEIVWRYTAETPGDFYAEYISGAQRQPNGNTLITSGSHGLIFEVTPDGEIVWAYQLPPTARAFRAEKYDLSAFAGFDEGQDLQAELGFGQTVWGQTCSDGTAPRLYPYLNNERETMALFIGTYGEDLAHAQWEAEACEPHGGLAG